MNGARSDPLLDFRPNRELDAQKIVRSYVDACAASAEMKSALSSKDIQAFDVSVLTSGDELSTITKRSSLVASRLLLAHEPIAGKKHTIASEDENDEENVWLTTTDIACPDLEHLADWLLDSAPLIRSGRVIYLPTVVQSVHNANAGRYDLEDSPVGPQASQAFDVFLRDGKATTLVNGSRLVGQMFVPLMYLDLPFIEGTSMRDFSHIAADNDDAQASTRDFLRRRLLDLLECETARELERNTAKLNVEISEGIRQAKADLRKVSRQRAVQAVGGVLATTAATLVALDGGVFREILPIIGATGGAWGFTAATIQGRQERSQIEGRPFYFFWLLEKRARGV